MPRRRFVLPVLRPAYCFQPTTLWFSDSYLPPDAGITDLAVPRAPSPPFVPVPILHTHFCCLPVPCLPTAGISIALFICFPLQALPPSCLTHTTCHPHCLGPHTHLLPNLPAFGACATPCLTPYLPLALTLPICFTCIFPCPLPCLCPLPFSLAIDLGLTFHHPFTCSSIPIP